jgi:hypothetical protein
VWTHAGRLPCPIRATLADSTDPQCAACAVADRGRAVGRDAALGDDGRVYVLYLAWFGPDLIKVGLTAADRGRDRLLEQGAIAYTPLAQGAYTPIRRAERLIAGAGLAPERLPGQVTAAAWWDLPPAAERARSLAAVRQSTAAQMTWPPGATPVPRDVTDQAGDFGLDRPPPATYGEVTGIADDAKIAGEIRLIVGRRLLIDTVSGPLLIDMRRIAGFAITAHAVGPPDGIQTVTRIRPRDPDDRQATLF